MAGRRDEAQALAGLTALFVITAAWWALALWPVQGAPTWLERTRYVCFGVAANGLPDAGGWIGLIGGPAGMLVILVAGWGGAIRRLARRARSSRPLAACLASLALGVLVLVTGAGVRVTQSQAVRLAPATAPVPLPPATYPRVDRPAPPLALTSQDGTILDLATLRGRPVLVTFAFAHCQTVCPVIVKDVLSARASLRGSPHEPAVLVVTLDPWRDTPSRLPAVAAAWGLPAEGAWVLSGSVADVEGVLDAWEIPRSRNTTTGDVTHPALAYVIDPAGRIAFASTGGADALMSLLRRL